MGRLEAVTALVTGAGRGIGRAIAQRYAAEGASLVITDIHEQNLHAVASQLRASGAVVEAFLSDVADPGQSRQMVERAVERFGRLDVLVNNAGVVRVRRCWNSRPRTGTTSTT